MDIKMSKEEEQNRKDIVVGAKSHIQSLICALDKFEKGSCSEKGYFFEHYETLGKFYGEKL